MFSSFLQFTTFRPFFINMNLPYSVVRGEQVVLQINVFNYMGQDLDVCIFWPKRFSICHLPLSHL